MISVTQACWRASEWSSARKSLHPRARRSEGLGSVISQHASEAMTSEIRDLVFAGEDAVQRLIVCSDRERCQ
ncbi:jg23635 [Pararge aegeria aegeria]|uniref:Jg23635 protein n=1 Tax=Pararge aegeria aegeria TaxID=348720 RepID=A0A8S4SKT1_9NEOP|nr:jg23635 [Pararge aegeria aegeria]